MTRTSRCFSLQLALIVASVGLLPWASAGTDFRIMTDEEIAMHTAVMAELEGAAREEYRNAQYEMLRQRAATHGYAMPTDPPWAGAAVASAPAPAEPVATARGEVVAETRGDDAAERHAAMREKMRAHREALLQAADAPPAVEVTTGATGATDPAATTQATPSMEASFAPAATAPAQAQAAAPAPEASAPVTAPAVPVTQPAGSSQAAVESLPAAPPAPVEPASPAAPISAPAAPAISIGRVEPPVRPTPPTAPTAAADVAAAPAGTEAMNAYRQEMRRRFDSYMEERQAQMEAAARRQREQREAAMAKGRQQPPTQRPMPYPYPNMPAYGPRYPSAYPGYRTPYWQQP